MTFTTETVRCPLCNWSGMRAEVDQANNLILACERGEKCGARIPAEAVVQEIAARHARESNELVGPEVYDADYTVPPPLPGEPGYLRVGPHKLN